jgi:hypothetical protein
MEQLDFFNTLEQTKPICPVCGNGFEKNKNYIQKYCSKKCNQKSFYEKNKDKALKKSKEWAKKNRDYCLEIGKRWRSENKDYNKEWYEKNKDKALKKQKKWYKENKDKALKKSKEWAKKNREKRRASGRKYYKENPKKIMESNSKHLKKKFENDKIYKINFKLAANIRSRIRNAIKLLYRNQHSIDILGCTVEYARGHLEKQFKEGMTWENHGLYGWHIDHIIPCASFDLTDPEQQKKCFHYTNLQPLWAKENMSKGAKIL